MSRVDALTHELEHRFADVEVGKTHFSVRYERGPGIVRVGAMIGSYNWSNRELALDRLVSFEQDHSGEFAVEFDIVPLEPVIDEDFAEA